MDIGEFVASERATCKACDKPAGPFCGRCAGVKYCSKVFPHPSTCKTIINATCRNVRQVTGKHTNSNALSSKLCEGGILIDGITLIISVTSKLIVSDSLVVGLFFYFSLERYRFSIASSTSLRTCILIPTVLIPQKLGGNLQFSLHIN